MVKTILSSLLALLVAVSNAVPTPLDQTVLSLDNIKPLDSEEYVLRVNTTFDAITLSDKKPMEDIEGYGYLKFAGYKIADTKAAVAKDLLNASDVNCAVSSPNALLILPGQNGGSAIFRSNETALDAAHLPRLFDFISFQIKPLVSNTSFLLADVYAWTIIDDEVKNVQDIKFGFYAEDGIFEPFVLEPRAYYTDFGAGANFIEFKGYEEDGTPAGFCIDGIVMEFHKLEDDE